jgi:hypothetical protein
MGGVLSEVQTLGCRKNIHGRAYPSIGVTSSSEVELCRILDMNFREIPECELRLYGVLGSPQHLASPKQHQNHSFGGCAWWPMLARVVALYNTAGLTSHAL